MRKNLIDIYLRKIINYFVHHISLLLGGIFLLIVMSFYLVKFGSWPTSWHDWFDSFSDDKDKWGQFGDFIGGMVNPLLGLVTIWLLTKSLRQNQEVQESTQRAMVEQIQIAAVEKDFNLMVSLLSMYDKDLAVIETTFNSWREPEWNEVILIQTYNDLKIQQHNILLKRAALAQLINDDFHHIIDRVKSDVYKSVQHKYKPKGEHAGFKYDLTFSYAKFRCIIEIYSHTDELIVRFWTLGILDGQDRLDTRKLLAFREKTLENAHKDAKMAINYFIENKIWPDLDYDGVR